MALTAHGFHLGCCRPAAMSSALATFDTRSSRFDVVAVGQPEAVVADRLTGPGVAMDTSRPGTAEATRRRADSSAGPGDQSPSGRIHPLGFEFGPYAAVVFGASREKSYTAQSVSVR